MIQKNELAKYLGNKEFQLNSGVIKIDNMLILQNLKQAYVVDSWYQVGFINNEYVAFPFVFENELADDTIFQIKNNITIDKDNNVIIKNDSATFTFSGDGNISIEGGNITIKGGNVVLEGSSIKLGSSGASFTPLCLEDLPSLLSPSPGTGGGAPTPGQITLNGTPKIQKTKAE